MKKESILGLIVLALLVAGYYWARERPSPTAGAPAGPVASSVAADPDRMIVDISAVAGTSDVDGIRFTAVLDPHPPVAFRPFRFRLDVDKDGRRVSLDGARVRFEMSMPMGEHRYSLYRRGDGWYEAEVTLPACPSGGRRWYATIEGDVESTPRTVRFRFDMSRGTQ